MIPKKIITLVREWAKEQDLVEIVAFADGNMEEKADTLYVVIEPPFNFDLSGKIADLELAVMEEEKYNLHMIQWPCGREAVEDYEFKELIYDKEQEHSKLRKSL